MAGGHQSRRSKALAWRNDAGDVLHRGKRLFDTTTLQGAAFAPLADEEVFSHPVLFHGVITWADGEIDIAPETVYRDSYAYDDLAV